MFSSGFMPRPDRSMPQGGQRPMPAQGGAPQAPIASGGIASDIRALNSSILLMTQKIKYVVRNEKILGRNLIVLNKKIKTLEERMAVGVSSEEQGNASSEQVTLLEQKVALLEAQIADLQTRAALKDELKELKYVINSINPLEFATLTQVRELIDKKLENAKKK